VQVICHNHERSCGFRVDEWYFVSKRDRFEPGQCPRDGAPLILVEDWTVTPVKGYKMLYAGDDKGRIVRSDD